MAPARGGSQKKAFFPSQLLCHSVHLSLAAPFRMNRNKLLQTCCPLCPAARLLSGSPTHCPDQFWLMLLLLPEILFHPPSSNCPHDCVNISLPPCLPILFCLCSSPESIFFGNRGRHDFVLCLTSLAVVGMWETCSNHRCLKMKEYLVVPRVVSGG